MRVLLLAAAVLLLGVGAVSAQTETPSPTPAETAGPPPLGGWPTATPLPSDAWVLRFCYENTTVHTGLVCNDVNVGNSMGGLLWEGIIPFTGNTGPSGVFLDAGVATVEIVNAPQWVGSASFQWVLQSYRAGATLPAMSVSGAWPNSQWWGYGTKTWSGHSPNCNPYPAVPPYQCWNPPAAGLTTMSPIDWCLHPDWEIPLMANGAVHGGKATVAFGGTGVMYRLSLSINHATAHECIRTTQTPVATPTVRPYTDLLTPWPTPNGTPNPWATPPWLFPTQIPPLTQVPYPTQRPYLTQIPYPTGIPTPTPNPTPALDLGGGDTYTCNTLMRQVSIHQSIFGKQVDWDFAGLQVCSVPYDISLRDPWGIPVMRFAFASLAIAMVAVIYGLLRT